MTPLLIVSSTRDNRIEIVYDEDCDDPLLVCAAVMYNFRRRGVDIYEAMILMDTMDSTYTKTSPPVVLTGGIG